MSTLNEARAIALDNRAQHALNKWRRDSETREVYTHQLRLDSGSYVARTVHRIDGKRDSYGLILSRDVVTVVEYMTPVVSCEKLIFDSTGLPVIIFDDSRGTIESA